RETSDYGVCHHSQVRSVPKNPPLQSDHKVDMWRVVQNWTILDILKYHAVNPYINQSRRDSLLPYLERYQFLLRIKVQSMEPPLLGISFYQKYRLSLPLKSYLTPSRQIDYHLLMRLYDYIHGPPYIQVGSHLRKDQFE